MKVYFLSPFRQAFKLFGINKMSPSGLLAGLPTGQKPLVSFHPDGRHILKFLV